MALSIDDRAIMDAWVATKQRALEGQTKILERIEKKLEK